MNYITRIISHIRYVNSYLFGTKLSSYQSKLNGKLELWLIDGKKILNSSNANLSYDSLHRVFQQIFRKINIQNKPPERVLLLGLGGGSVPCILLEELQFNCKITAIEHDPMMIELAIKEFNINRFKSLEIVEMDAYEYVTHCNKKFDLIIVDLFLDDYVPLPFCEEEFNTALIKLLDPGYILFNFINKNLAQANQFEKLQLMYNLQRNLLVSNYHLDGNNDMLVAEKIRN
ncbi:MAG: fused MFS/spermidine synthase [Bacteroidota bacterium]|nr:fused MFS/spermidine synthase [Bacteroidota bacterium]